MFFKKFSQKAGSGSAGTDGLADATIGSGSRTGFGSGMAGFAARLTNSGREASNSSIVGKAGFSGRTGSGFFGSGGAGAAATGLVSGVDVSVRGDAWKVFNSLLNCPISLRKSSVFLLTRLMIRMAKPINTNSKNISMGKDGVKTRGIH
ncbi:MAG: hypothetical protein H7Z75_22985 [Ferruginibacter sp.]|nr:hypothetical protein [Cytophagales bacterium]